MCGIFLNEVGENDKRIIFVAGESSCVATIKMWPRDPSGEVKAGLENLGFKKIFKGFKGF